MPTARHIKWRDVTMRFSIRRMHTHYPSPLSLSILCRSSSLLAVDIGLVIGQSSLKVTSPTEKEKIFGTIVTLGLVKRVCRDPHSAFSIVAFYTSAVPSIILLLLFVVLIGKAAHV